MAGLMVVKSNEQMDADEAAERDNLAADIHEPITGQLVGQIHAAWSRNKRARQRMDNELLACLRQRKGEYEPDELALIRQSGGGNTIYMMLTATKCAAAAAWIQDVMLPSDDLPVGLEATPIAELPAEVYRELVERVMRQAQENIAGAQLQAEMKGQPPPTQAQINEQITDIEKDIKRRVNDKAKERADKMTTKVRDTLEEAGLRSALEDYIEDFVTYPTAILKGPVYRTRPKIEWGPNWQPTVSNELTIETERVSPFDAYPAPDAETIEDGEFIERVRFSRQDISAMRGRKGYDSDAIERVLRDEASGVIRHWIWTDSERHELENKENWWISPPGVIDALHYWGHASGMALMEWGMDPAKLDPLTEYNIEAILIGHECIRCVINDDPFGRRPYQAASFRRTPGAFWGESLPYLVRNTQKMCNSVARSLADNLAISSGPQVMVNVDTLAEGEDVTNLHPWKIWQVSYDVTGAAGNSRPIDFFQPSINAGELLTVFKEFEQRADDESAIPRYTYGNEKVGGAGSTASGLSMLFDATAKGIRKAIGHIDAGVMRPLAEKVWMDEMRFGTDQSIKGDGKIVSRGAAALLIKDQAQMRRQEFLGATANEIDMQIIGLAGRAEVLRENAKALDMDPDRIVPKREEIEQRMKAQQQPDPKAQQDAAKLEMEQAKLQQEAQRELAELQQKAQSEEREHALDERRFKLDVARWLSGEEERQFQRTMGLQIPEKRVV